MDELRSQHWAVKLAMIFAVLIFGSPFIVAIFSALNALFGAFPVILGVLALSVGAIWFLGTRPKESEARAKQPVAAARRPAAWQPARFCASCGARFSLDEQACPDCGVAAGQPGEETAFLAAVLNDLAAQYVRGALSKATYRALSGPYELRLARLRPQPAPQPPPPIVETRLPPGPQSVQRTVTRRAPPPPRAAVPPAPPPPLAPTVPSEPSQPFGELVTAWAAERQADILLYLGAFLVSMAAIIFVAYQGEAVSPLVRLGILAAYTLAFLALGIGIQQWERAREAGPVFLALGAVLVPIDFGAALRVGALDQIPRDVLWLAGSGGSAALYSLFAWRGYGRYYVVPAIPAVLIAWGSLGSVLSIPVEWFGAWYQLTAVALYVEASRGRLPLAPWIRRGGAAIGVCSMLFAAAAAGSESHHWQLAATYLLASAGLASGLPFRRSVSGMALMPATLAMAAGAAAWAAADPDPVWFLCFVAAAGAGYLVVANFDLPGARDYWRWSAFLPWTVAVAVVVSATAGDGHPFALPATLAVVAASVSAGVARWRTCWRPGLAVAPALLPATAGTFAWAWLEMPVEWAAPWIAAAAVGYLVVAEFDTRFRADWQAIPLAVGALSIVAAVAVVVDAERGATIEFVVPATLGLLAVGTAVGVAGWRFGWRPGIALLSPLLLAASGTLAWAWFRMPLEWAGPWVAAAAAGYLIAAELDRPFRTSWQACAMALGAAAIAISVPAIVAAEAGSRQEFVLAATLAVCSLATVAGVARWRLAWRPGMAVLPALLAGTAGSLAWAWLDAPPEWAPAWIAIAAAGYLVPAEVDHRRRTAWQATALGAGSIAAAGYLVPAEVDDRRRTAWQTTAQAAGAIAVAGAVLAVLDAAAGSAQEFVLPATLGICSFAVVAGVGRWRLHWRPGVVALPALLAAASGSLAWAWLEMPPEWAPAWIAAAAIGYLIPAAADARFRTAWQATALGAGSIAVAGAVIAVGDVERDSPREYILPATLAILAAGNVAAVAGWWLRWREAVAILPVLAPATVASFLWAAVDMSPVWTGAWLAVAAAGYLVPAEFDPALRNRWRAAVYAFGGAAIAAAHIAAADPDLPDPVQLPVAYGVALAVTLVDAFRRRDLAVLAPPALAAAFGATALWAAGVAPEWWAYPSLGLAAALATTEWAWRRSDASTALGWSYVLALAAAPALVSVGAYNDAPGNGLIAFAATAVLAAAAAVRCNGVAAGTIFGFFETAGSVDRAIAHHGERATLSYISAAFALGAAGYFNALQEIGGADRAWAFLAVAVLAWLAGAAGVYRNLLAPVFAVPPALAASSLAAGLAAPSPGTATIVLAVSAVTPGIVFATTRFAPFWLASAIFASLATWSFWTWAGLPEWTLSGAYLASAFIAWLALFGARRYGRLEPIRDATVHALSWAPWLVAALTAWVVLAGRSADLAPGERLLETSEWAMLTAVVAGIAAAVTAEGWRLHNRWVQQVGTAGLLAALLMTIAIGDPSNVQAYAAPVGLYIVATGLTIRGSEPLFGRHMDMHEALQVIGATFIVLPPAEQSFEPGGAIYGFELIGIGLGFLFLGLILHARWLVPAGVLTITGVAVRWLTGGFVDVPFWLILGIVGTVLLAVGTFILLQRERWDAWRTAARLWWFHTTGGLEGPGGQRPAGVH